MICCKITANYNSELASFGGLMRDLQKLGDVLWENGYVYFGCVDDYSVNEKKIGRILRKNGYKNFYIDIYSKDNQPHDTDYINGWITDRIIKINYKQYEDTSQAVFKDISKGLDMLDDEINKLYEAQVQTHSQEKEVES